MSNKKIFIILFITLLVIGLWFVPLLGFKVVYGTWGLLYVPIFIINMMWFSYLTEVLKQVE